MDEYRFLATALVVGLIGPLFWLGVNVFDGWVQRNIYPGIRRWWALKVALLREKIRRRKTTATTEKLGSPGGVGQQRLRR